MSTTKTVSECSEIDLPLHQDGSLLLLELWSDIEVHCVPQCVLAARIQLLGVLVHPLGHTRTHKNQLRLLDHHLPHQSAAGLYVSVHSWDEQ